jgi:hypothetical protein
MELAIQDWFLGDADFSVHCWLISDGLSGNLLFIHPFRIDPKHGATGRELLFSQSEKQCIVRSAILSPRAIMRSVLAMMSLIRS